MGAHTSGQHVRARELLQEIFALLKQTTEPEYVVQAHHAAGSQMVAEGEPHAALDHIDQLLSNYRVDVYGNHAFLYGAHDPACCSLGTRALSLMMLGQVEQALAESSEALELSKRVGHQPNVSHTHLFRAELYIILNRPQEAEEHLDASMALARKYSLAFYLNAADNARPGSGGKGRNRSRHPAVGSCVGNIEIGAVTAVSSADSNWHCWAGQSGWR
jgi:tetratricopeptide (TPR) repeat protein